MRQAIAAQAGGNTHNGASAARRGLLGCLLTLLPAALGGAA